jgi:hypothetical protein
MSGLGFLLIVVVVTLVGSLVVWLRHRKPTHFMSSVDDFEREMRALDGLPAPTGRNVPRAQPSGIHENRRPRSRLNAEGADASGEPDGQDSNEFPGDHPGDHPGEQNVPFEQDEEGR